MTNLHVAAHDAVEKMRAVQRLISDLQSCADLGSEIQARLSGEQLVPASAWRGSPLSTLLQASADSLAAAGRFMSFLIDGLKQTAETREALERLAALTGESEPPAVDLAATYFSILADVVLLGQKLILITQLEGELGPLGTHREAPLGDDDQGELGVAVDTVPGHVRVFFGAPITWLALSPEDTKAFANILMRKAEEAGQASPTGAP